MTKTSVPGHDADRASQEGRNIAGPWGAPPTHDTFVPASAEPVVTPKRKRSWISSSGVVIFILIAALFGARIYEDASGPGGFTIWGSSSPEGLTAISKRMTFNGQSVNVLSIKGDIGPRSASWFRNEVEKAGLKRGDLLLLSSPGGRVDQSMIMGEIVRAKGLATAVGTLSEDAALDPSICASACAFVYMGGAVRHWTAGSRLGVHQFSAVSVGKEDARDVVADTQRTTGMILSYVAKMGVSPLIMEKMTASKAMYWITWKEAYELQLATVAPISRSGRS